MTAAPARTAAPLSVAEEALWLRSLLAPDKIPYNETISLRKHGALDLPALRAAFNEIVRRHEAWRTRFDVVDGAAVQIVEPPARYELPLTDLSDLSEDEAERHAVELVARVSRVPYDLRRGSLLRPRLIRFPGDHHRLYLAMHHVIFDGVSVTRVILPELVALYNASVAGEPSPLPAPPTRYVDYAEWEHAWISGARTARRMEHWRSRLSRLPSAAFPLDHPRPASPGFRGGAVGIHVAADTVGLLRRTGQSHSSSLFQVLAATWALLLVRYSGGTDVVFAVAADLRQRPEFEMLVGYSLTTMPVRVDAAGDPTFAELVSRVRNDLLDGLDNVLPFERIVRELGVDAGSTANPIYQTMIVLEPSTEPTDPSWSLHQIDSAMNRAAGVCKLDLELQLDERADGHLDGQLIYDRELFDESTARRVVSNFELLLEAAANDSSRPISQLATLTSEEQRQLLAWNATATEQPGSTIPEQLRARAGEHPDAPAVSADGAGLSYGELSRRADAVAAALITAGVGPGELVSVHLEPSINLVVGALGASRAGAAFVLVDPTVPPDHANAAAILTSSELAGSFTAPLVLVDRLEERPGTELPALVPDAAFNAATALASELLLSRADTVLSLGPNIFRDPLVELWLPLLSGARLVIAPPGIETDGRALSRLVRSEHVTFLHARPSTWRGLTDTGMRPARGLTAVSGGESLSEELAHVLLDRCRVLWNAYGVAETTGYCTLARIEEPVDIRIGRPIANANVYVVDDDDRPVPVGATGHLLVADASLAPTNESARVIENPFGDGRAVRTGDFARWLRTGEVQLVDHRR